MKDPYKVFGLSEDASKEELQAKYDEMKARYAEDRFLPGEPGNEAARKLSELEAAWREINEKPEPTASAFSSSSSSSSSSDGGAFSSDYAAIDALIKEGRYDDAQIRLDAIADRAGEWHYLQSIIYYKREWMNECKTQLEMAVNKEPSNQKYRTALNKLNRIMGDPNADPRTIGVDPNTVNPPPVNDGQLCGNACSSCCFAYMCSDCCCTLTQCC
ncbi:MAG: hypothetical protein LBP26_02195 [Clostridiales bacterium]|jgi:hypothetical protein|nr:hypothetical protein [Clostridiales bacterium]